MATLVTYLTLITPNGTVLSGTPSSDPVLHAALVGLGLLGVITSATLKIVPLFHICKQHHPCTRSEILSGHSHNALQGQIPDDIDSLMFFVTQTAAWYITRVKLGVEPGSTLSSWSSDGKAVSPTNNPSKDFSHKALAFPPHSFDACRQTEAEFFLPAGVSGLAATRAFLDSVGSPYSGNFTVFARYVAADDFLLSPARRRHSLALTLVVRHGPGREREGAGLGIDRNKFAELQAKFEKVCREFDGRPHWAKRHLFTKRKFTNSHKNLTNQPSNSQNQFQKIN